MALGEITPEEARAELERRRSGQSDGITAEQARAELERRRGSQPRYGAAPYGLSGALTQGASFGFADEISSGLVAGIGGGALGTYRAIKNRDISEIPRTIGQEYIDLQESQRAGKQQFTREHPVQSIGGEIAGGALSAGAGLIKAPGALAAAGTGAIQGGAYGFGASEGNALERLPNAAKGAAFGAAAGAAFNVVAGKVAKFWQARAGKQFAKPDEKRAYDLLVKSLSDDLGGRNKAEAALRVWIKNGARSEELFDIGGPVTQNLYREIASQKPTPALEFINKIKDAQAGEIRDVVQGSLNKGQGSVKATRAALQAVREQQAAPLYEQVYAQRIDTEDIAQLISERPDLQTAMKAALRRTLNRGNQVIDDNGMITVEVLDKTKQALDDKINILMRQGAKNKAGDLISAKRALVDRIDELVPEYAQARGIYAGTASVEDAMQQAKNFLKPGYSADDLSRDLARLGESEREFYKVAVAEEFEALIDRTRDVSNKGAFISTESMRNKLRTLFADDPNEAEAFIQIVKRSEDKFRRLGEISPQGGSQTEPRLRAKELFDQATRSKIGRAAEAAVDNPVSSIPRKAVKETSRALSGDRGRRVSDVLSAAFFENTATPLATAQASQPVQIPYRYQQAINPLLQNRE